MRNEDIFIREQIREVDAAWRSMARAQLSRFGIEAPSEEQLVAAEKFLEAESHIDWAPAFGHACNCDQSKALQAENAELRARLARLEGGGA